MEKKIIFFNLEREERINSLKIKIALILQTMLFIRQNFQLGQLVRTLFLQNKIEKENSEVQRTMLI